LLAHNRVHDVGFGNVPRRIVAVILLVARDIQYGRLLRA
jgi:hypothetical protein